MADGHLLSKGELQTEDAAYEKARHVKAVLVQGRSSCFGLLDCNSAGMVKLQRLYR